MRDTIYEEIMEKGWSEKRQSFVQYYGSEALDASNLLMPLTFFISPTDPRMLSTLDATLKTLVSDSLVYRYQVGKGASDGQWDPFRYDAEDGFDTQEWVGKQSWCNGRIGTAGGSYVGWTQWASAPNASKYLKAMVPIVPFSNAYDLAYDGGAFQLALLMGWGSAVGGAPHAPAQPAPQGRHPL